MGKYNKVAVGSSLTRKGAFAAKKKLNKGGIPASVGKSRGGGFNIFRVKKK